MTSGLKVQTLDNGSIYFVEINFNDNGAYLCEMSNGIGSPLNAIIQVTVHG